MNLIVWPSFPEVLVMLIGSLVMFTIFSYTKDLWIATCLGLLTYLGIDLGLIFWETPPVSILAFSIGVASGVVCFCKILESARKNRMEHGG